MEYFVDVLDEDFVDVVFDIILLGFNLEINGVFEDSGESDFDVEYDMVDRFFFGLVDDGNDSIDEEGDKKRIVWKGSKILKLKIFVVGREVSLVEFFIFNVFEELG